MSELSDEDVDNYIDYLVTEGALVLTSVDEYGEPIWNVNYERMQEVCPEYLDVYHREIEDSLITLFEHGLVEFDVSDEGETIWSITEAGENYAQTQGFDTLP